LSARSAAIHLAPVVSNVSAGQLIGNSKTGRALYTGHARLWQGDSVLEAEMKDSFIPFHRPSIGEEEIAEVVDTLRSVWLTTGVPRRHNCRTAASPGFSGPALASS
jgi:hypothetical protein